MRLQHEPQLKWLLKSWQKHLRIKTYALLLPCPKLPWWKWKKSCSTHHIWEDCLHLRETPLPCPTSFRCPLPRFNNSPVCPGGSEMLYLSMKRRGGGGNEVCQSVLALSSSHPIGYSLPSTPPSSTPTSTLFPTSPVSRKARLCPIYDTCNPHFFTP